jgi:hypothetical protein
MHLHRPDRVHWVYFLHPVLLDPVTLERVLLLLHLGIRVQIFHGHSTLDTAQHEALLVGETPDSASLVLEVRLALLQGVGHVAYVPYQYFPAGRAHHQLLAAHAYRVHLLALVVAAAADGGSRVPQLDMVVPAARQDAVHFVAVLHALDGVGVCPHAALCRGVEVERFESVVEAAAVRMDGVLKMGLQYWGARC